MTDDEVRALLARQSHREVLPHPAATVAILRRDVQAATDDVRAVDRWIGAHNGERRIGRPTKSTEHRTGNGHSRWHEPFSYWVVPVDALRAG